jgi:two-component system sensor histidine kinase/response regulator
MKAPLHILYLEDDAMDAELVEETLAVSGIACRVKRVQSEPEFVASLEQGGVEMILADYSLPCFDGLAALKIARRGWPHLPFIFVSGTLDEEVAIEALKIGATDYVFKTRLSRIAPSVQRALREAGKRSELERAEEARRRSEAYLAEAQRLSHTGSFGWRIASGDIVWSEETFRIFDFSPTVAPNLELILQRVHPDDRVSVHQTIDRASTDGTDFEHEYRLLMPDGLVKHVHVVARASRDGTGSVEFVGAVMDVTVHHQARALLEEDIARRKRAEAAEAANRAKDEFLANVSHEIRTPMNAILGMTELVLDTSLNDDQRRWLKTVKSAADNLLGMINDLLDFSKIEAGKMELDLAEFSLRAALDDTLRALALRAHKKGLELICDVQPEVPDALIGDATRLRQILLNLVANAIKFTDEGEIVLRVEVGASTPIGEVGLQFTVRDSGIGISPEKQEKIFCAFEQEDTSTTRRYGGTGLGLSIAAQLVALMGGKITVDSEPRRGSTFAFTARFACHPHPSDPASAQAPALLHKLPVLIVDDNASNCHILEEWSRSWRMEPVAVCDGVAAMEALSDAAASGNPYQLVLLDARMPDTDGLVLAGEIRERAELSAARIILLISGDIPGDLAHLRELRIDAHLFKPVQQFELLATISRVMRRASSDRETSGAEDKGMASEPRSASTFSLVRNSPADKPLRILVAEDNEFNAQLLEQLLVRRGHHVRLVKNGRDALTTAEEKTFDLLLLDVHMPELDGYQVIRAIRERERSTGGHLPVIALTARSREEDRERCLAAGMDDFLTKPIQAGGLWIGIDRVMRNTDSARAPTDRPSTRLVDASVLLSACGGDPDILETICNTFRARLPDELAGLHKALANQDARQLREGAHKLFGMMAAFSAAAGAVVSGLEDHAARGQLDQAATLMEQLNAMTRELPQVVANLSIESLRQAAGNGKSAN